MKKMISTLINELLIIVLLVILFVLLTTVVMGVANEIWPPVDGEPALVRITASHTGFVAIFISFVITMYVHRFSLAMSRKSKFKKSENERDDSNKTADLLGRTK